MKKLFYKQFHSYVCRTKDIVFNAKFNSLQKFRPYHIVGGLPQGQSYYKYFPWQTALKCIKNSSIAFVEPTRWNDRYESLYYEANYSNVSTDYSTHPRIYATCATKKKYDEPAWRIYSGEDNICVQFEIDRVKFRMALINALEDGDALYEGEVQYTSKTNLERIGHRQYVTKSGMKVNKWYSEFVENNGRAFSIENYLNLLLLKRGDFEHENESRFFIVKKTDIDHKPSKAQQKPHELYDATKSLSYFTRGDLKVIDNINWIDILKGVLINAEEDSYYYNALFDTLKNAIASSVSDISKREEYEKKLKPIPYFVYGPAPSAMTLDK